MGGEPQPDERKEVSTEVRQTERTGSDLERRFPVALGLYLILAALVWFTMGEGKVLVMGKLVEMRLVPLIVIGGLALRTVLARQADRIRRSGDGQSLDAQKFASRADVAQLVEHSLGKGEVTGSSPVISSKDLVVSDQLSVVSNRGMDGSSMTAGG